jgi:hypothetical protein
VRLFVGLAGLERGGGIDIYIYIYTYIADIPIVWRAATIQDVSKVALHLGHAPTIPLSTIWRR